MISITVLRGSGDRPGPEIVDPLLTSVGAARERGRVEIDRASTHRAIHQLTGPYRRWLAPGSLIEVQGRRESWRGLVRRTAITIRRDGDSFQAQSALEIEREP